MWFLIQLFWLMKLYQFFYCPFICWNWLERWNVNAVLKLTYGYGSIAEFVFIINTRMDINTRQWRRKLNKSIVREISNISKTISCIFDFTFYLIFCFVISYCENRSQSQIIIPFSFILHHKNQLKTNKDSKWMRNNKQCLFKSIEIRSWLCRRCSKMSCWYLSLHKMKT